MKEKKLNCTVECNPLLGPKAFDAVEAILAGKTLEKWTKMSTTYYEPPVSDELLASRKY